MPTSEVQNIDLARAERLREACGQVRAQVAKAVVGQEETIEQLLIAMLARGHCLLEGVPGLAKTLMIRTLADAMHLTFHRIQFTPDLMPADITGTDIIQESQQTGHRQLVFQKGPIFSQMVLADEINRTPPKTQAALLEAMQERQVTIGMETFPLDNPFLVMATQNPVEQEGTYQLPEAQTDRFMLKVVVDYPTRDEELKILQRMSKTSPKFEIQAVTSPAEILAARELVDDIYVDSKVQNYIVDLVMATRRPEAYGLKLSELIQFGGSPRATINLTLGAKANAFLAGRGYVTPADVKEIAMDVLRHRVVITYEAEAEDRTSESIVSEILKHIPTP